jgi:hypothetical protein
VLLTGSGASLFSPPTCDVRFKNSVIQGTETFLYSTFLNPELIVEALLQASGQASTE